MVAMFSVSLSDTTKWCRKRDWTPRTPETLIIGKTPSHRHKSLMSFEALFLCYGLLCYFLTFIDAFDWLSMLKKAENRLNSKLFLGLHNVPTKWVQAGSKMNYSCCQGTLPRTWTLVDYHLVVLGGSYFLTFC